MLSAVILAAGQSQRMGESKLLLPLKQKPLLHWVLQSVLDSQVDEVICIVRNLDEIYRQVPVSDPRLFWLVNYAADRGQSTSVVAGLWAVHPESDGALFIVGDQPLLRSELVDALIERFSKTDALVVAPSHNGQTRNPVLFRRSLFGELVYLTGDRGGRGLIEKYRTQTELVDWPDESPFLDVDTPADYERLLQLA